jgi:hypothetical protein
VTHQVIVELIAATTTRAGLSVQSRIDPASYKKGRRTSDRELAMVNLHPDRFHGEYHSPDRGLTERICLFLDRL